MNNLNNVMHSSPSNNDLSLAMSALTQAMAAAQ